MTLTANQSALSAGARSHVAITTSKTSRRPIAASSSSVLEIPPSSPHVAVIPYLAFENDTPSARVGSRSKS